MKRFIFSLATLLVLTGCLPRIDQYATGNPRLRIQFSDPQERLSGHWTLDSPPERKLGSAYDIDLVVETAEGHSHYHYGNLTSTELGISAHPPVPNQALSLVRDAGTLTLTQGSDHFNWSGQFDIHPNHAFGDLFQRITGEPVSSSRTLMAILRGVKTSTVSTYSNLGIEMTGKDLWDWIDRRIKIEYVTSILQITRRFSAADISQLSRFNVSVELIKSFQDHTTSDIIELHRFGVTPQYSRGFREHHPAYSPQDVISLKRHGVPAEWASALDSLPKIKDASDMIALRRSGASPSFARATHRFHFVTNVDDMVSLRRHGLTSEFIEALDYLDDSTTTNEIIQLRRAGITADFHNTMRQYGAYSIDDIIKMRRRGITPDYVLATVVQGKAPLSARAIIDLRNRGVSTQTIRELRQ